MGRTPIEKVRELQEAVERFLKLDWRLFDRLKASRKLKKSERRP